jgi:surface antigen
MLAPLLALALALGACAGEYGNKQTMGTLLGGGAGALVGAQFGKGSGQLAMTAVGTLVGAFIGAEAGRSLDKADRLYASRAEHDALEYIPTGGQATWQNPDSGNYGSVEPVRTYQSAAGAYCREYYHTVYVGGERQQAYGTACRQADGSWQVVN